MSTDDTHARRGHAPQEWRAEPPGVRRGALLRRYLRAVLGDQATGDRLAAALLPGAVPGAHATHQGADARFDEADLLCGALRRWRRLHKETVSAAPFSHAAIARAVSPSRALVRQAGILCDVFALTVPQAAHALDRSEGEVVMLLTQARAEAARPIGQSVLIVEDDALIGHHLAGLAEVAGASDVRVAGSADEAYAAASASPPGIVLCDYALGDGDSGADVVRRMMADHDAVCLFVTAYPDRVLRGMDGEPAFVVSKPFRGSVVRAALAYAAHAERPAVLAA